MRIQKRLLLVVVALTLIAGLQACVPVDQARPVDQQSKAAAPAIGGSRPAATVAAPLSEPVSAPAHSYPDVSEVVSGRHGQVGQAPAQAPQPDALVPQVTAVPQATLSTAAIASLSRTRLNSTTIGNVTQSSIPADVGILTERGNQAVSAVKQGRNPSATAKIAFSSKRDGHWQIYAMNPDGSDQVNLSNNDGNDYHPAWSPDGTKLAFASDRDGNWEIYVMNADGSDQTNLTNTASIGEGHPTWSPDGSRIVYMGITHNTFDLYFMNADGSDQINITGGESDNQAPAWSPDGSKVAFTSYRDGNWEIYVADVASSDMTRLTDDPGVDSAPAWSPDGSKIAFHSTRDGGWQIYTMNADGSDVTRLTNNTGDNSQPEWSPDGSQIAFASSQSGNWEIYSMNADGSDPVDLTNNAADEEYPSWQYVSSLPAPTPTPSRRPTATPRARVTPTKTPKASATPQPAGTFGNITFSAGVTANDEPVDARTSFPEGITKVYAVIPYTGDIKSNQWRKEWYLDGELQTNLNGQPWSLPGPRGTAWFNVWRSDGLASGEWEVRLYLQNKLVRKASFTVESSPEGEPYFGPIRFAEGTIDDRPLRIHDPSEPFATGITEVYAFFDAYDVPEGANWTREWYLDGKLISKLVKTDPWELDPNQQDYWVGISNDSGLGKGVYELRLYIEGQLVQLGTCEIAQ